MRVSLTALVLALCPAVLHANGTDGTRSFNNYCTTGTFRTCASVSITITTIGTTTTLSLTMQNLQGTHPADNSGGSYIAGWFLRFPGNIGDSSFDNDQVIRTFDPGTANLIGDHPLGRADMFAQNDEIFVQLESLGGGISGCNVPPLPLPLGNPADTLLGVVQTCGPNFGPVTFTFTTDLTVQWDINNMRLGLGISSWTGNPVTGCAVDVNCHQVTVIPEPATMVLVGSGLAALAGFRRRRRQ